MHTTGILVVLVCTVALGAAVPGDGLGDGICSCSDIPPPGDSSCVQQKDFGKCERGWMKENKYCSLTCGHCSCADGEAEGSAVTTEPEVQGCDCVDVPPSEGISCEEQAQFGKCERSWMEGFCLKSCSKCSCVNSSVEDGADSAVEIPADTQPESDGTISGESSTPDVSTEPNGPAEEGGEDAATPIVSGLQTKVDAVRTAVRGDSSDEEASTAADADQSAEESTAIEQETVGEEGSIETQQQSSSSDTAEGNNEASSSNNSEDEGSPTEKSLEEDPPSATPSAESQADLDCQTVTKAISNNPELTSLATAIETAKIGESLDNKDIDVTVFAPTNAAFKSFAELLGEDALEVLGSPEALRLVLSNHVTRPAASAADIAKAETLTTLANIEDTPGSLKVFQAIDGKVLVDGHANRAAVVTADIQACNSIIHTVDAVLPPVDFPEIITASK